MDAVVIHLWQGENADGFMKPRGLRSPKGGAAAVRK